MDYNLLKKIKEKLSKNDFDNISSELNDIVSTGSTGGEIMSMVGFYLKKLSCEQKDVYDLIGDEIKEFLNYAKSRGLNIP